MNAQCLFTGIPSSFKRTQNAWQTYENVSNGTQRKVRKGTETIDGLEGREDMRERREGHDCYD